MSVVVHTDVEVEETVSQIQATSSVAQLATSFLATRDAHWAERDAALQRLGDLVQNGALNPSAEDYAANLKAVIIGLVTQLPDLRSAVVRSACSALALLVAEVGDHASLDRPLREQVLPALISLVSNGNKVLASAGRECLPTIVMCCHFDGMLKVLATTLGESRHVAVRHSCCVCLLYALQRWPIEVLSTMAALLERALVPAATDAAVEVRPLPIGVSH